MIKIPNLTQMNCSRGAPMGRYELQPTDECSLHLHKVPLDNGGYDGGGAYWGLPDDLWRLVGDDTDEQRECQVFFRAKDRAAALAKVKEDYDFVTVLPLELHFESALTACLNTIDWDWELSAPDYEEDPWVTLDDESKQTVEKGLREFIEKLGADANKVESADLGTAYWMGRQYGDCSSVNQVDAIQQRVLEILDETTPAEWEAIGDHLHIYP